MALTADKFILPDGPPVEGAQPTSSSSLGPPDLWDFGSIDYADLATQSTPFAITGGAGYVPIPNDGAGVNGYSNPPSGVTNVWDVATQAFDFTQLSIGDMIDIRLDMQITTTATNQEYDIVLELGQGVSAYQIPFAVKSNVKTAGAVFVNRYNGIYIGNALTLDNPGQFKIQSTANATLQVNGWYCKVIKKGRV